MGMWHVKCNVSLARRSLIAEERTKMKYINAFFLFLAFVRVAYSVPPGLDWVVRDDNVITFNCNADGAVADSAGFLYLTGSIDNGLSEDIYTVKYNSAAGETLWSAVYRGPDGGPDGAVGIALDGLGGLYVAGFSHNGTDFEVVMVKYDAAGGQELWARRYGAGGSSNEYPAGCAIGGDGNPILLATCCRDTAYQWGIRERIHLLSIKMNAANGDTIWTRHYDEIDTCAEAAGICLGGDGKIYAVGTARAGSYNDAILLVKIDPAFGDTIWTRRYSHSNLSAYCMASGEGAVFVAGADGANPYYMKVETANGDTAWTKTGTGNSNPTNCLAGSDGSIYIAGLAHYNYGYFIAKINNSGGVVWSLNNYVWQNFNGIYCAFVPGDSISLIGTTTNSEAGYSECFWGQKISASNGDTSGSWIANTKGAGGWCFANDCAAGGDGVYLAGGTGWAFLAQKHSRDDGARLWRNKTMFDWYGWPHRSMAYGITAGGAGTVQATGFGGWECRTLSYSGQNGDTLWTATHAGNGLFPTGKGVYADEYGFPHVTGHEVGDFGWGFLIKYEPFTGDTVWVRDPGTNSYPYEPLPWGDYESVCAGSAAIYMAGRDIFEGHGSEYKVVKCSGDSGLPRWERWFSLFDGGPETATGCALTPDGDLIVCGNTIVAGMPGTFVARHESATGDTIWARLYAPGAENRCAALAVDDSGNIYTAGTVFNGSDYDILAVGFSPGGDTVWSARYDGPNHGNDYGTGCAVDSLGFLYVCGNSHTGNGCDIVLIRYGTGSTGTAFRPEEIPVFSMALGNPRPNPSPGGAVTMELRLSRARQTEVAVYNTAGQRVRTLHLGMLPSGIHHVAWDGRDQRGNRVSSGVYICRALAGETNSSRKLVVIR